MHGQRIIFVEPHGMIYENAPEHSGQDTALQSIGDLSETMRGERSPTVDVTLDSYIGSATKYLPRCAKNSLATGADRISLTYMFSSAERSGDYDYLTHRGRGD